MVKKETTFILTVSGVNITAKLLRMLRSDMKIIADDLAGLDDKDTLSISLRTIESERIKSPELDTDA